LSRCDGAQLLEPSVVESMPQTENN